MRFEGYGGLERDLGDERGLCWRMNGEEEKNWVYRRLEVGHGRATLGTGRANFLWVLAILLQKHWHGRANLSTGRANLLVRGLQNFQFFLNHTWTITYKTLKTTKNK